MKKHVLSLLFVFLLLMGCDHTNHIEKGKFDIEGKVTQIDDESNRILIQDTSNMKTWVSLPEHMEISKYVIGDVVVVWTNKILESNPAQAKALNIQLKTPNR